MSPEGMRERPKGNAAASRAVEYRDARESEMANLARQYREAQMKVSGFEKDLKRGDENMLRQGVDPEIIRISKEVRAEIQNKLEDAVIEREELEQKIRERGGDPSEYTVQ